MLEDSKRNGTTNKNIKAKLAEEVKRNRGSATSPILTIFATNFVSIAIFVYRINMATNSATSEEELHQFIVPVCAGDDPEGADWVLSNKDKVYSTMFFINEKLPARNYELLQLAALGNVYARHSLAVGLCGLTMEQIGKEREKGEQFIFPGLDESEDRSFIYIQRALVIKRKIHRNICGDATRSLRTDQKPRS